MEAPLWFVIIMVILMIIYLLRNVGHQALLSSIDVAIGKKSGCGCLFGILFGIAGSILVIAYIISELL